MIDLKNKVALITGSSRGIGFEIASFFASLGCSVILNSRNQEQLELVKKEIKSKYDSKIIVVSADVSKDEEVSSLCKQVYEEFDKVDIVINNAGITKDNLLLRMKEEDWEAVLNVNLKSAFLVTKYFSRYMLRQGSGKFINISSVVGEVGNLGQANYAASKAGLIGFSKSMAKELAGKNITVNVIAPGYIETEMTGKISDKMKEFLFNNIPLKRFGKSKDVAFLAAFLASDSSGYITGQVISVNGGMVM